MPARVIYKPTAIQFSLQGVTEYAGDINMTSGYIQVIVMFGSIFLGRKNGWSANNFTKNNAFCRYIIGRQIYGHTLVQTPKTKIQVFLVTCVHLTSIPQKTIRASGRVYY